MNILLGVVLAVLIVCVALRERTRRNLITRRETYLRKFTPVPQIGAYQEAAPRISLQREKIPHAVLLLHGYSASADEFKYVIPALEQAKISYYAPLMTGFGLQSQALLHRISYTDWLRDVLYAYDFLASTAETISVVGHSNGGTLAIFLAQNRPIKHLILSGPNFAPADTDKKYRRLLLPSWSYYPLSALMPIFAKPVRPGRISPSDTLDPETAVADISYLTLPTHSLREVYRLQDQVDILKARYQTLSILYGKQDLTVDIRDVVRLLDAHQIPYLKREFANSGHNIVKDYDREAVAQALVSILSQS